MKTKIGSEIVEGHMSLRMTVVYELQRKHRHMFAYGENECVVYGAITIIVYKQTACESIGVSLAAQLNGLNLHVSRVVVPCR